MKTLVSLFVIVLFATACNNSADHSNLADSTAKTTGEPHTEILCFNHLEGKSNQDTSSVRLMITGNTVTGDFLSIPSEKDSRKGTLQGTKQGNIIKGLWIYMQEGMWDTISVEFKLEGNKLMQKSYSVNPETGRQFLSDTSAFSILYNQMDCTAFPQQKQPENK